MNKIIAIVATDQRSAIGKRGKIPWSVPEDLKRFKELTTDNVVVMGRKAFESIGRPLPDRINIVVSKRLEQQTNIFVARSIKMALNKAKTYNKTIFIIGGAQIYLQCLHQTNEIYLTIVDTKIKGADTYFLSLIKLKQLGFKRVFQSQLMVSKTELKYKVERYETA